MGDHFCIDGQTGTLAVWTGGTDLGPVTNPSAHPTRVRFNSRQPNLGFLPTPRTGSVNVSNWAGSSASADASRRRNLFAHGLSYKPLLMGYLTVGGSRLPIQGSVLHRHTFTVPIFFGYTVGADDTYVYLNQLRLWEASPAVTSASISYTIWLGNYGVTGSATLRQPPYFNGVDINAGGSESYVKAGYFDTQYRYPYRDSSGTIPFVRGPSMSMGVGYTGDNASLPVNPDCSGIGWRYSANGYVLQRNATAVNTSLSGRLPGNNASFNATIVRLSL